MFMKSFEPVYKELEDLFIQKLPGYIEKINKEHNDGIILKRFENRTLEEDCIKKPWFKFSLEESEYSEKDRIIENNIFTVGFEIQLNTTTEELRIILWRYVEAIKIMLDENETDFIYTFIDVRKSKIIIRIIS